MVKKQPPEVTRQGQTSQAEVASSKVSATEVVSPRTRRIEAATEAAIHAAQAAVASAEAASAASAEHRAPSPPASTSQSSTPQHYNLESSDPPSVRTDPSPYPPPPNIRGEILFWARGHPRLPDGVYTTLSLRDAGEDPDIPQPNGILKGFKSEQPLFRAGYQTGDRQTVVTWW